ncbi:MAG: protein kinase domain-containing protein, partial [Isosphaeraceae bacterium]
MITPSQVESIFFAALDKKTTAERADYLDDACGDDAELRGRVERLLEAHPQAVDFLARPAVDRPDVAERDRETGPPKANESERPTVNDRPAPGIGRHGDSPGRGSLTGPAPTTSPDVTADIARIDERQTENAGPGRREDHGRSQLPDEVAFGTRPDYPATLDVPAGPIAGAGPTVDTHVESPGDAGMTVDVIPGTSARPAITDPIVAGPTRDSDTEGDTEPNRTVSLVDTNPDRTVTQGVSETDRTVSVSGSSSPSKTASPAKSRTDGPSIPGYEILGTLGRGGMGIVYKARQTGLNRLVALKMIIGGSQAGSRQLARFRIEAEAVAQLRHPNIVQIYDVGEVDDMPYVALEFLDGGDLAARMDGTPQPGIQAAELLATLARAIHAAHQARIVHRDLKPENVLLSADGVPKITDFGLAKRLESDDNQTNTGDIMGTPSFMAPEQAMGRTKEVGPAADIYALGAILYDALTGRPPLKGETMMETIRMVVNEEPVPPSRLVPRLARDLETICLKCLNKAPEQRYATAEEFAEDLDRYREGKPIKARPISLFGRGIKWSRRHPVAAASLLLGVLAFLSLAAGLMVYQEKRNSWVLKQNDVAMELLDRDVKSRSPDELRQDQVDMATFLREVRAEPRLQPISVRIAAKQKSVEARFQELSSNEAAQQRAREDRERFATFQKLRQEAQLYAAGFGVLDPTDRSEKLRASAHAALATYAKDPQGADDVWSLADPSPTALQESEKARLADDCYDLLLIRSQASEPAEGLRILDRALRLRPKTTAAYHRRRADCLERAGDSCPDRWTRSLNHRRRVIVCLGRDVPALVVAHSQATT